MAARDSMAKDGIRRLLRPFRRKKGESEDVPGHTDPEEDLPRELFEDVREELHKTIDSELMGVEIFRVMIRILILQSYLGCFLGIEGNSIVHY